MRLFTYTTSTLPILHRRPMAHSRPTSRATVAGDDRLAEEGVAVLAAGHRGLRARLVCCLADARGQAAWAAVALDIDGIVEQLPTRDELKSLETEDVRLGLATHRGARFVAPPNPEAYPHVAWALATHATSSHAAHDIAKRALDGLDIYIRPA